MYRVLLPVDVDEERAELQAETLLSLPRGDGELVVTLLYVYETVDAHPDEAGPSFIESLNLEIDEIRDVPESIGLVRSRLEEAGVDYEFREVVGDPAAGILTAADDVDANCILLGMRNRSPVGKAVFGSVSQEIILDSERPVVVAR